MQPKSSYVETASSRLPVPDPTNLTTEALTREIGALKELFDEKLLRIETQIKERDVQTEKASRDVKSAVDAAFAAAKEAVGEQNKSNALSIAKSETAFVKQVDGIGEIVKNNTKTTDDKITDLKDRLTMIEGRSSGHGETWSYVVTAIASFWAVAATIGLIAEFVGRH